MPPPTTAMGGSQGPGAAEDDMETTVCFVWRMIVVLCVFFDVVGDHLHDHGLVRWFGDAGAAVG